jgi:hypothetical protein
VGSALAPEATVTTAPRPLKVELIRNATKYKGSAEFFSPLHHLRENNVSHLKNILLKHTIIFKE